MKCENNCAKSRKVDLIDSILMAKIFEDVPCTELLLQSVFCDKNIQVVRTVNRYESFGFQDLNIMLDVLARDDKRILNIEIRTCEPNEGFFDMKHNQDLFEETVEELKYSDGLINEFYSISLLRGDALGMGLPIYHTKRRIKDLGEDLSNTFRFVYVNMNLEDDSPIGRLMHDLNCGDVNKMYNSVLKRRVRLLQKHYGI